MKRILIAGIGNIFHGDDAFGCAVARQLASVPLAAGVTAVDFGTRSYDLAYALGDGYDAVIFVDAASRGGEPGALHLLELDPEKISVATSATNGHSLNPIAVLQLARAVGTKFGALFLVGCEPGALECEDGQFELSRQVAAAVPEAIQMVLSLVKNLAEQDVENWNEQSGLPEAVMERS